MGEECQLSVFKKYKLCSTKYSLKSLIFLETGFVSGNLAEYLSQLHTESKPLEMPKEAMNRFITTNLRSIISLHI